MSTPSADMLETPPGYPFEEIEYGDIDVEEVGHELPAPPVKITATSLASEIAVV